MARLLRTMNVLLVFLAWMATVPAWAQTEPETRPAIWQDGAFEALVIPVVDPITDVYKFDKILEMDFKRLMALALGLGIGAFVGENYLGGGVLLYVGLIGGGLLGEWWYNQGHWPFGRSRSWW